MKEQYVKPKIFFESFSLTQTIARTCGDNHTGSLGQSNHYDEYSCQWVLGDQFYFFDGVPVPPCADAESIGSPEPGDDVEIYGMCYNNPDGGREVFSST